VAERKKLAVRSGNQVGVESPKTPPSRNRAPAARPVKIDDDFHGWLLDQASALRRQKIGSLDWKHLAEELEAMAAAERRELLRRLTTLFAHMLKIQYQAQELQRRGRSWRLTVLRSRTEIRRLLDQSPGLKGQLKSFADEAYRDARRHAGEEMNLARHEWERRLPAELPWSVDQALDFEFMTSESSQVRTRQ
jgi:Domain of unknown function DUF29